ncbi:L-fucose kinase-like [Xenia sp. Carnegie-2017]|uniref:L-fucose kinase-like n=1 Tax=Xenia sp. Carnegie-2017 TaxID=2897299 RepID=UPI001F039B53|nr:L-fucose kinase-like [Xenia sp. Carnegie-2017]
MEFDAIVVTCVDTCQPYPVQKELEFYQSKGKISSSTVLLAIDDPKPGIGSGSAMLNALLVVTEHLSARAGYTVVESQVLKNARILILQMGSSYPFSSVGKAFKVLPCTQCKNYEAVPDDFITNLESILLTMSNILAINSPPGVWACSTDMILGIPSGTVVDWSNHVGVRIFSIPSDVDYARNHGIIQIGENNVIEDIFYLASDEELKKCTLSDGQVPIAPVLVFFSTEVATKFLTIVNISPLDSCTYLGLDQGSQICRLAFVWDILLLMAKNVTEEDFVSGDRSMSFGRKNLTEGSIAETRRYLNGRETSPESVFFMRQARRSLWLQLRGITLTTTLLQGAIFDYISSSGENHRRQMLEWPLQRINLPKNFPFFYNRIVHSFFEPDCKINEESVVINSFLQDEVEIRKDCVLSHCRLTGSVSVGQGCILTGISPEDISPTNGYNNDVSSTCEIPKDTVVQTFQLSIDKIVPYQIQDSRSLRIMVVYGVHDLFKVPVSDSRSTYCNKSWNEFFAKTGIRANELWPPHLTANEQSFLNAKLFPVFGASRNTILPEVLWLCGTNKVTSSADVVKNWRSSWRFSLKEILDKIDISAEFRWQRRLYYEVGLMRTKETLMRAKNNCLLPFFKNCVLQNIGLELLKELDKVACNAGSADCVARTFSCIADVLSEMAGNDVGLRSGPAANEDWMHAYRMLENGNISEGVMELANQRKKWMERPDLLIRAARHYEGAMQILIRHAVMTGRQFINFSLKSQPPIGLWFIAESPARVDLSGAWSDTPPVTYELGGAVTNIAIKIRGKKPLGAKVRKIHDLQLLLVIASETDTIKITCNKLSDLQNYSKPNAPGALLKAAVCCTNIIDITSKKTLQQQLQEKYNGGFEVQSWSNLPKGSGLGSSSILSGVLMAALLSAAGIGYDTNSLIHAVLHLEQMMTTGGGWQDQVGGLLPGIKLGTSEGKLPLKVEAEVLKIDDNKMKRILDHSVLVFTGKPRLAKNMLQGVIRNWYTRKPEVISTADWIARNAKDCAKACVEGDLEKIAQCLNNSWEQKKIIAPGCEPPQVMDLINALKPHIHGFLLTGAGGGGFLYAISKEANFCDKVPALIERLGGTRNEELYKMELDNEGLTVRTE